jgi:DNA primase
VDTTDFYSKFRNRIMFPICDYQGTVIAFIGRTPSTDEKAGPKYLRSPETPIYSRSHAIFNLDKAKGAIAKLDYSILVEGQIDCILVYAAGFHNVIASSGIPFTGIQAGQLGRLAKQIVVTLDCAAARAMEATIGLLVEEGFNIRVIKESSVVIRRGRDAYAEALKHSQSYSHYLIDSVIRETQSASAERALILGLRMIRQELASLLPETPKEAA